MHHLVTCVRTNLGPADICESTRRPQRDHPLAALLYHGPHVPDSRQHLRGFLADLLTEAAVAGHVLDDAPPTELAAYCLHALGCGHRMSTRAGVERLVATTISGLRPWFVYRNVALTA